MTPRRVLLVLPDPPLPFGSAASRWFYVLLRGLLDRGHRVTAFVACSSAAEIEAVRDRFPEPADVRCHLYPERRGLRAKWETLRRPRAYTFSPALVADLEGELALGHDVLHLEQHWTGWLGLGHTSRALLNVHYLYEADTLDLRHPALLDRVRHRRTIQAERELLRSYPTISAVTPRLRDRIAAIAPGASLDSVPLGLDTSLYPFEDEEHPRRPPVVTLIGSFNWQPTYSAGVRLVTRLWPEIRARVPEARLRIVGRDAMAALGEHLGREDLEIRENVPDIIPYFRDAEVMLYAPGRGTGLKVKVQEAFALGLPVVTNAEGVEGLPAEDGVHAGVCDDDAGLVERTVALLLDPAARSARRRAARALIEEHCDPDATVGGIERLHERIIAARAGRGRTVQEEPANARASQ